MLHLARQLCSLRAIDGKVNTTATSSVWDTCWWFFEIWQNQLGNACTLKGTNISHLGKRKIIFKMPFSGDMLVPWRVNWTAKKGSFLHYQPCTPCTFKRVVFWKQLGRIICLVVSTHLKNISQTGSFPEIGMKINKFQTTTQSCFLSPPVGSTLMDMFRSHMINCLWC